MNEELEQIVESHKNLIYKIASKYKNYYQIEDLFQVGVIGLIKAKNNYSEDKNTKFSTYAYKYILGEILEFMRTDRAMKISPETLKIYKAYEKSKEFLTNHYNKIPSLEEISNFMGIDYNEVKDAIERSEYAISLDANLGNEDFTLDKIVGNDNTEELDNLIDLRNELQKLSELDKKIIELRYYKEFTQSETAEYLGINQVKVSRYENKILKKIKTNISA